MLKVTGASDDLIEMYGALNDEFDAYDCGDGKMAFSDGTILKVEYEDGIWRFKMLYKGTLFDHKDEGSVSKDEGSVSKDDPFDDTNDVVYFKPGIKWAVFAKKMQIASYSMVE